MTLYQPPSDGNPLCEHWKPLIASALTVAAALPPSTWSIGGPPPDARDVVRADGALRPRDVRQQVRGVLREGPDAAAVAAAAVAVFDDGGGADSGIDRGQPTVVLLTFLIYSFFTLYSVFDACDSDLRGGGRRDLPVAHVRIGVSMAFATNWLAFNLVFFLMEWLKTIDDIVRSAGDELDAVLAADARLLRSRRSSSSSSSPSWLSPETARRPLDTHLYGWVTGTARPGTPARSPPRRSPARRSARPARRG